MKVPLDVLSGDYAICRLPPDAPVPEWAMTGPLWTVARTADELSVVCLAQQVPPGVQVEPGWRALRVAGTLDFGLTGVLAALASPLADAGVSLFAFSTFDTDYILVRAARWPDAIAALRGAGHVIQRERGETG